MKDERGFVEENAEANVRWRTDKSETKYYFGHHREMQYTMLVRVCPVFGTRQ